MSSSPRKSTKQLVATIDALGGVARQKDLLRHGFTPWNLKQALAAGTVEWISRGYYALPDADALDVELDRHQARRTCFTKAGQLGLWVIAPMPLPHVAAAHSRTIPGYVVYRVSGGQTLVDILRQCVKCGSEVEAPAVLESAVVLKKCTIHELLAAFAGRKDAAGRSVVAMIDPQSQLIVETVARYYLLVDGLLGVETDGERYHNTPSGWVKDALAQIAAS